MPIAHTCCAACCCFAPQDVILRCLCHLPCGPEAGVRQCCFLGCYHSTGHALHLSGPVRRREMPLLCVVEGAMSAAHVCANVQLMRPWLLQLLLCLYAMLAMPCRAMLCGDEVGGSLPVSPLAQPHGVFASCSGPSRRLPLPACALPSSAGRGASRVRVISAPPEGCDLMTDRLCEAMNAALVAEVSRWPAQRMFCIHAIYHGMVAALLLASVTCCFDHLCVACAGGALTSRSAGFAGSLAAAIAAWQRRQMLVLAMCDTCCLDHLSVACAAAGALTGHLAGLAASWRLSGRSGSNDGSNGGWRQQWQQRWQQWRLEAAMAATMAAMAAEWQQWQQQWQQWRLEAAMARRSKGARCWLVAKLQQ